jgi:hypothetical protein
MHGDVFDEGEGLTPKPTALLGFGGAMTFAFRCSGIPGSRALSEEIGTSGAKCYLVPDQITVFQQCERRYANKKKNN